MLTGFIKRAARALSPEGRESLDPTPVAIPVGFKRPPSLEEQIKRLVADRDIQRSLSEAGMETFEEANDFEIPDDPPDPAALDEEWWDPALRRTVTAREVYEQRDQLAELTNRLVRPPPPAASAEPPGPAPDPEPPAPKKPAKPAASTST